MKVVIDKYVPYLAEVLGEIADVISLEPDAITAAIVQDADALIIRTRTRCNSALLEGSQVQFIATATIGFDHIDTEYCAAHGIYWTNCPGCNAQGVADFIECIMYHVECRRAAHLSNIQNSSLTLGVIGVGHVGSKVVKMAGRKGYKVLVSDPPREARGEIIGTPLLQIAREADIITFHTPLTKDGDYPTWHLVSADFFAQCKSDVLIINAARGGVIDEDAWLQFLESNPDSCAVVDCWEGEPHINHRLLERAWLGTYHIAGYTLEGKYNASRICLEALTKHFKIEKAASLFEKLHAIRIVSDGPQVNFDIAAISDALKANPEAFEQLRKGYVLR